MDVKKIIVLVIGVLAFIFCAACTGGNNWIEAGFPAGNVQTETSQGLWQVCSSSTGNCLSIDDSLKIVGQTLPGWYMACRAMAILSCLGIAAGLFLAFLGIVNDKIKGFFASVFLFGAAVCMLIALSVYTSKNNLSETAAFLKLSWNYGWSFVLGWIGVVAAGVSGLISIFA